MKPGELVKSHVDKIILYCQTHADELLNLQDGEYSKINFNINYPFFADISDDQFERGRYWVNEYRIADKQYRVTREWKNYQAPYFIVYLQKKGISLNDDVPLQDYNLYVPPVLKSINARYKSYAIGNAQNSFIRHILSNIGEESFSSHDWENTKKHFNNRCAYCGSQEKIVRDHAVPINKENLGEHKLGNIVPSCERCNDKKSDQTYVQFLNNPGCAEEVKISQYMKAHNYEALNSDEVRHLLNEASNEIQKIAIQYIEKINAAVCATNS